MKVKKTVIDHLRDIHNNKSFKRIKFEDGSISCDIWTASVMLCVYNSIGDVAKSNFEQKINSKLGFMQMAQFAFATTKPKK